MYVCVCVFVCVCVCLCVCVCVKGVQRISVAFESPCCVRFRTESHVDMYYMHLDLAY